MTLPEPPEWARARVAQRIDRERFALDAPASNCSSAATLSPCLATRSCAVAAAVSAAADGFAGQQGGLGSSHPSFVGLRLYVAQEVEAQLKLALRELAPLPPMPMDGDPTQQRRLEASVAALEQEQQRLDSEIRRLVRQQLSQLGHGTSAWSRMPGSSADLGQAATGNTMSPAKGGGRGSISESLEGGERPPVASASAVKELSLNVADHSKQLRRLAEEVAGLQGRVAELQDVRGCAEVPVSSHASQEVAEDGPKLVASPKVAAAGKGAGLPRSSPAAKIGQSTSMRTREALLAAADSDDSSQEGFCLVHHRHSAPAVSRRQLGATKALLSPESCDNGPTGASSSRSPSRCTQKEPPSRQDVVQTHQPSPPQGLQKRKAAEDEAGELEDWCAASGRGAGKYFEADDDDRHPSRHLSAMTRMARKAACHILSSDSEAEAPRRAHSTTALQKRHAAVGARAKPKALSIEYANKRHTAPAPRQRQAQEETTPERQPPQPRDRRRATKLLTFSSDSE
eukprot:TRINITY_DN24341_c0_g1_i2.p1 TRINITY_DN24341_c0_g1~~TRINITY_DN24341_c0_g1_i2.p1  ORF type:complete len:513 (+),score=122.36 TRINITY_DN24341_c0_g1_i2:92-1630(+)